MKKVKVKTKQKQKQKQKQTQIVNIHLDKILKQSQPKRKSQPKQYYSAQPITFNAPPIREYIDTSLYNIPSKAENPLLARTTINPIPDIPITINPTPINTVGLIQPNPQKSENPLYQEPTKPSSLVDNVKQEPINSPSMVDEINNEKKRALEKNNEKINKITKDIIEQEKIKQQRKNEIEDSLKKQQEALRRQLPKRDIGPSQGISLKRKSNPTEQTNINKFFNIPNNSLISPPLENQTIISEPTQQQSIIEGLPSQEETTQVNPIIPPLQLNQAPPKKKAGRPPKAKEPKIKK